MNRIEFHKTNHIFLDNGIIALYRYLQPRHTEGVVKMILEDDRLIIEGDNLPQILEDVYYEMGKAVYDTITIDQEAKKGNIYIERDTLKPHLFPKMVTYGFSRLLTNNIYGLTRDENNTVKFKDIQEQDKDLALRIDTIFAEYNIARESLIYFNEPYTKITRLVPFDSLYLKEGTKICYLTGDRVKKLVDAQNISPFISGIKNFNSNLTGTDKKISWKALYLSRFAAAQCLYAYSNPAYKSISVFFFGMNSLIKLADMYEKYIEHGLRIPQQPILRAEWQLEKYVKNFRLVNTKGDFFSGKDEYHFMILYTIFRGIIQKVIDNDSFTEEDLLFELDSSDFGLTAETPYLVTLKADSFSKTIRPNSFETVSHLKYIMQLFCYFESQKFDIDSMIIFLKSLRIVKPTLKKSQDDRVIRNKILQKILNAQSVLDDIEQIYYDCYVYLLANEQIGIKNFWVLRNFIELYESKVNIKKMNKELQKKAIDLGYSMGSKMIEHEGGSPKNNARQSRKYIIDVRNSRTFADFLDALNRISSRFSIGFKHEFAEQVDEDNYRIFKSFLTLGMFNAINPILQPKKEEVAK